MPSSAQHPYPSLQILTQFLKMSLDFYLGIFHHFFLERGFFGFFKVNFILCSKSILNFAYNKTYPFGIQLRELGGLFGVA